MSKCPEYSFDVTWEPYFLRPNMPEEGIEKAPDTPENPRVGARMKQAGAAVGINFTGKCDRAPNTMKAHCLSEYIKNKHGNELQNQFQEKVFEAYFTTGLYPSIDNLISLLPSIGLSDDEANKAREVLESGELENTVASKASRFSRQIRGVPFFIINNEPAFSGAQDVNTFVSLFHNEC